MQHASWLSVIVFLLLVNVTARAAELTIPDCKELGEWAGTYHPSRMIDIAPKVQLVNIFGDEASIRVFGKRALDWNAEEYRAVSAALRACAREYRKDRQRAKLFSDANAAMGRSLRRAQNHLAQLDRAFESARKRLLEQPETARTYRSLADYDTADELIKRYRQLAGAPTERTEELVREITEFRAKLRADAIAKATQALDGLPEAPKSLVEINTLEHQVVADYDDQPERQDLVALQELAQSRRAAIRDALIAGAGGKPPLLFPACEPFLAWASAANIQQPIQSGAGIFYDALLDEKLVPVFARPLDQWTDEEVALFRDGMQGCMQAARARGQDTQAAQGAQKAYLLGNNLPAARTAIGKYKSAKLALEQQRQRIAQVEPTPAGLQELQRMQYSPELGMLGREEQQRQRFVIQQRQREISAAVIEESVQKLASFDENLKGLEEIGNYGAQVHGSLQGFAEPALLQRFEDSFHTRDADIAARALPEFEAELKALPIAPESSAATQRALERIVAPRQRTFASTGRGPGAFRSPETIPDYLMPYREAAEARTEEIEVGLHQAQCGKLLADTALPAEAAKEQLLGALGPTTLGDFVCRMLMTGQEFHSFEPAADGKDYTLKITARGAGYQTILLHTGEVGPGQEMLVGRTVSDANVSRTLTVQEWQSYAGMLTGQAAEAGLRFLGELFKGVDQQLQQMQQKSQR